MLPEPPMDVALVLSSPASELSSAVSSLYCSFICWLRMEPGAGLLMESSEEHLLMAPERTDELCWWWFLVCPVAGGGVGGRKSMAVCCLYECSDDSFPGVTFRGRTLWDEATGGDEGGGDWRE